MSLIDVHLEQIRLSCREIDSLRFPPPKMFANAMLSKPDITTLIRDTEPHERALFSVPAPPTSKSKSKATPSADTANTISSSTTSRRTTIFNVASGEVTAGPPGRRASAAPRRHTAVAAVLGGEMHDRLRKGAAGDRRGELDVEVLLAGAEKLCTVYELPGARERILALRTRHRDGRGTLAYYEARVAEQGGQLAAMDAERMEEDGEGEDGGRGDGDGDGDGVWTEEDLRREEEEARMMEVRKRELQMRLKSMQKDLGGLRDMRALR